jgi:putative flippase GtrA
MWAQVLRFGGVGGAATVLHVTVALAVQTLFQAPGQVANLAGFAAAVLLSYLGHARYTFGVDAQSGPQFARFLLLSGLGLATSSATVWLVATKLGFGFTVAMVAVAIVVPTASYLAMRFWVFQHR